MYAATSACSAAREHCPCTVADDLVEQRPARRAVLVGRIRVVDYSLSMGVPSRTSTLTPALDPPLLDFQIILGKVRPFTSPGRGPSTSSDHCSGIARFP